MTQSVVVGSVLYGADKQVLEWVAANVPVLMGRDPASAFAALGVVRHGKLVAGVVFHNYRPGVDMEVTIAASSPLWMLPNTLRRLFDYPFEQLKVPRLTCVIGKKNKRCRKMAEGIGWRLEGTSRKNYDGVQDAIIYGMFKNELKIKPRERSK
jgi:RimJ/RimL family protein N-acetyltransferase